MRDPYSLEGSTVLVTGASSGIGRECCIRAAARGARILATGRDRGRLEETAKALVGAGHQTLVADLSGTDSLGRLAGELPELDGIVHAAGVIRLLPVKFLTEEALREAQRLNLEAPLLLTRDLFKDRKLARGGSVVFVASVAPMIGAAGHVAYSASKGALIAAGRVMAREFARRRVRVNSLCPGTVRTPLLDGLGVSGVEQERSAEHFPLGLGEPEDVAHAAVFLLADASRWMTGTSLVLDGGRLLQ